MPRLDKKQQSVVENAPESGFLMPEGRYAGQLAKVEERNGQKGPYWSWEFTNLHNEEGAKYPGRQWFTTSLAPQSAFAVKQAFDAFGYAADSDTDEIVQAKEWAVLTVIQQIAQGGKRQGETVNQVARLSPFEADDWPFDPDAVTSAEGDGGKDDF